MREVEFRRLFDENNAARIRFQVERGRVLEFVVQLECRFRNEWHAVVRYDTAHGYAHVDVMHPAKQAEKIRLASQDHNAVLTEAISDLAKNWALYGQRYEQWLLEKNQSNE